MENNEVVEKLQNIFREVFDDETIILEENTTAKDIEMWDSLTHIEMISSVKEIFGVSFSLDEIVAMKSVKDIVNTIMKKI